MTRARALAFPFVATLTLALLSGCTTVLKQAYYEVRGATGDIIPVFPADVNAVEAAKSVRFEKFTTTAGPQMGPAALLAAWNRMAPALSPELQQAFPGGDPVITIEGEVLYWQEKGIFSGALNLTRVKILRDGKVVADGIIKAESQAFRKKSPEDVAKAGVGALHKWLLAQKSRGSGSDGDDAKK